MNARSAEIRPSTTTRGERTMSDVSPTTMPDGVPMVSRDTRKKDQAPRGVFRHRSRVWAVRFTCGAGHIHQERVGPLKSEAIRVYHERRARVMDEPGWCPKVDRLQGRERARREQAQERGRVKFGAYAVQYLEWAKVHHRSYETTRGQVEALIAAFGERKLDEVTPADVERFL